MTDTAGAGVAGRVGGHAVAECKAALQRAGYEGASVSLATVDGVLVGALHFEDQKTPCALRLLRKAGIQHFWPC